MLIKTERMESNFTFSVLVQNLDCKQVPTAHFKRKSGYWKSEITENRRRPCKMALFTSHYFKSNLF